MVRIASRFRGAFRTSPRVAQALRLATVAAFIVSGVLFYRLVDRGGGGYEQPEVEEGQVSVADVIAFSRGQPLVVRGFVFEGPGSRELRLCDARQGGGPPRCIGPFVSLHGVDVGNFETRTGATEEGPVRYSPEAVTIRGVVIGTIMEVAVVLGDD